MTPIAAPSPPETVPPTLFVSGWWQPPPGGVPHEVRRAAPVFSREGALLGRVAAVAADPATRVLHQLVLGQVLPGPAYRLIPSAALVQVTDAGIHVRLSLTDLEQLPCHTPA